MSVQFNWEEVPTVEIIETDQEAAELLRLALRKVELDPEDLIGWDTETHGKKIPIKSKPLDWMKDTVTFWSLSFALNDSGEQKYRRWCIKGEHFHDFYPLLEHPGLNIAGWNLKYDAHIAYTCGVNIWNAKLPVDGLALAQIHDENRRSHGLKSCAQDWCGLAMTPYKTLFNEIRDAQGKKAKEYETSLLDLWDLGHKDTVADYASYDAYAHLKTVEWLIKHVDAVPIGTDGYTLWDHFKDTEIPFTELLWRMERRGMYFDIEEMEKKIPNIQERINDIEREINNLAGRPININSPKQIAAFMFSDPSGLNLKPVKMTPAGQPSTDEEVMNVSVEAGVEVAAKIVGARKLGKTKSTYMDALCQLCNHYGDHRIHPSFNQLGAKCMPAGELVLTNRGYLPVEKVKVGDEVLTHMGRSQRVAATHNNGQQPVVVTTLSNGLRLRTTKNHQYLTPEGWVFPKDLYAGKSVVVHSGAEEWAVIPDWTDFEVSSWGRVRNKNTGHLLKLHLKNKWGHLKIQLYRKGAQTRKEGDRKDLAVHRLVAKAFVPNPKQLPEVRHRNGYAWDNTAQNLTWGTSKDNGQDAVTHGSINWRYTNKAKLTEPAVKEIRSTPFVRSFRRAGYTSQEGSDYILARKFNVSREMVRDVRLGKRWQPLPPQGKVATFDQATVVDVKSIEPVETYGLTVEEDHSHVTGGIVTHNTGRLSTQQPNSQNFPRPQHDEWGIRQAFIAPPGYKLIVSDYCFAGDTLVETPNGRREIKSIKKGDIVYTFDQKSGKPRCQKVEVSKKTGRFKTILIVLDNGEKLRCTPEHNWLSISGEKAKAGNLKTGDRLLSFRRGDVAYGRPTLYSHSAFKYTYEHKAVATAKYGSIPRGHHVHHKNANILDNSPENLECVPQSEHQSAHGRKTAKKCWENPEIRRKMSQGISDSVRKRGGHHGEKNPNYKNLKGGMTNCLGCGKEFYQPPCRKAKYCSHDCYSKSKKKGELSSCLRCGEEFYTRVSRLKQKFCSKECYSGSNNHKVVGVIKDFKVVDTYNLQVATDHNYALAAGVFVSNCQIEMRIMAHMSGDERMLSIIREGKDLHSFTVAAMDPNIKYEEVIAAKKAKKPNDRQKFLLDERQGKKAVGFGIIYGAGPPKISQSIPISDADWQQKINEMDDKKYTRRLNRLMKNNDLLTENQAIEMVGKQAVAAQKIQEYFQVFPSVKGFMDYTPQACHHTMYFDDNNQDRKWEFRQRTTGAKDLSESGHQEPFGFVTTLSGRLRRLPDIDHPKYQYKTEAERQATNTRIQGSAADITKAAMLMIENNEELQRLGVVIINQVHDEIVMQVPEENAEEATPIITHLMEHPFGDGPENETLDVPTPVDLHVVDRWADAK